MSTAAASSARQTRSSASTMVLAALGGLLALAVLIYATLYFGQIRGEEFSPDSFQRRTFSYSEIPLLRLQVWPVSRDDITGELEQHLVQHQLIPPTNSAATRWDLVSAQEGSRSFYGDARILCYYLDAKNAEGKSAWLEWSQHNAELAKALWPVVAQLARQQLYSFIPDLLRLATHDTTPEEFRREMSRVLTDKYLMAATVMEELGRPEQAVELYTTALEYAPDSSAAQQGLERSRAAAGPASTQPVMAMP